MELSFLFDSMAARQAAQKISLWKRGWHEIPEVMFAGVIGAMGLFATGVIFVKYRNDPAANEARYRFTYTVLRESDVKDDPTSDKYN